jgi:hypothetical protein
MLEALPRVLLCAWSDSQPEYDGESPDLDTTPVSRQQVIERVTESCNENRSCLSAREYSNASLSAILESLRSQPPSVGSTKESSDSDEVISDLTDLSNKDGEDTLPFPVRGRSTNTRR